MQIAQQSVSIPDFSENRKARRKERAQKDTEPGWLQGQIWRSVVGRRLFVWSEEADKHTLFCDSPEQVGFFLPTQPICYR
ncbi:hypothetical protein [Ktedonobacter robiniae]|uniref:Uncharacterized protein n=1 Tax=Ktedonobacter robiniae TaxID=2778365 RepID=A0ABQ3V4S3_9CHLR|nr:hypothetical protein [Ktedonobacter robiniae]GHO59953.1 hypothetical protein KSB_84280 [Ktedonobacter robiniae]